MAPLSCIEPSQQERARLLVIARASIEQGMRSRVPLSVSQDQLCGALSQKAGSFITLTLEDQLRGCIGTLEDEQPLAQSVATNAFKAAFQDRRFAPLPEQEISAVRIDVAILSPPEPMLVDSYQQLMDSLRPGEDGLIIEDEHHRATFLPKVWERLKEPGVFIAQLMNKAGLPEDYWSDSLRFSRYRTVSFAEDASAAV